MNPTEPNTMNAHTPGPLKVIIAEDFAKGMFQIVTDEPCPATIAFVCDDIPAGQANAELFALAPTLLRERDELRQVLNDIEQMLTTAKPIDYKRDCIKAFQMAQAALARTQDRVNSVS